MRKLFLLVATSGMTWGIPAFAQPAVNVHFCGETLPQHLPNVNQRWFRTLNRQASYADHLTALKHRASAIFPIIEPIIERYGIPKDFKYLPLLESAVVSHAVSRKGAAGFWQIMPITARRLGLSVAKGNDERFNLSKATHAACRYLKELYNQLGSWMLVAAAYNAGPNYIQALRKRYPDRHPINLPYRARETKAYIYQAIAIKELITHPQSYRDYFNNERALANLSKDVDELPKSERQAILAYYETPREEAEPAPANVSSDIALAADNDGTMVALADTAVVSLLTDEEDEEAGETVVDLLDEKDPDELAADQLTPTIAATNFTTEAQTATGQLLTRRMGEGTLTEGQLCMFEVIRPDTLNGVVVSVGDVLYAHVDMIEPTSGRVYLRTEKLMSAKTQETIPFKLSAVDRPKQPGVPIPARQELAEGWRLRWEQL